MSVLCVAMSVLEPINTGGLTSFLEIAFALNAGYAIFSIVSGFLADQLNRLCSQANAQILTMELADNRNARRIECLQRRTRTANSINNVFQKGLANIARVAAGATALAILVVLFKGYAETLGWRCAFAFAPVLTYVVLAGLIFFLCWGWMKLKHYKYKSFVREFEDDGNDILGDIP